MKRSLNNRGMNRLYQTKHRGKLAEYILTEFRKLRASLDCLNGQDAPSSRADMNLAREKAKGSSEILLTESTHSSRRHPKERRPGTTLNMHWSGERHQKRQPACYTHSRMEAVRSAPVPQLLGSPSVRGIWRGVDQDSPLRTPASHCPAITQGQQVRPGPSRGLSFLHDNVLTIASLFNNLYTHRP